MSLLKYISYLCLSPLLSVELIGSIWVVITGVVSWSKLENTSIKNSMLLQISNLYPHCLTHDRLIYMYLYPYIILLTTTINLILITLLLVLLCILTRYLATRYLNHPFKRTLYKYIAWGTYQTWGQALSKGLKSKPKALSEGLKPKPFLKKGLSPSSSP